MNFTQIQEDLEEFFAHENIGAKLKITNERYYRTDNTGRYLGGTSASKQVSFFYLEITFKNIPVGLPAFEIHSSVFLRNFFTTIFSIFGVTKKRKKFSAKRINKSFDFYFPKTTSIDSINNELQLLFSEDANKIYSDFIKNDFNGELIYDTRQLLFKTLQIPENKDDLDKIKMLLKHIFNWINLFKSISPNPIQSVKRIGQLITPELLNEIKWKHPGGEFSQVEYPELVYDFINVVSTSHWQDTNYGEKPVVKWLEDPAILARLELDDLKSLFTFFVRQERFCEGFWQKMIEKEYIKHVLTNPVFKN